MRSHAPKARTRQALWNVKQEKPELFDYHEQLQQERLAKPSSDIPAGFEPCAREGWLYHQGQSVYFEKKTGRFCWLDASNELADLHLGQHLAISFVGGAASRVGAATAAPAPGAGAGGVAAARGGAAPCQPKHVVVPDLHRAAQALKVDLGHLDRPAAIVGVFGVGSTSSLPADVAARAFHERLIKRLAAFRGEWSDEALCAAVRGTLSDIDATPSESRSPAVVALAVGHRLIACTVAGASYFLDGAGGLKEEKTAGGRIALAYLPPPGAVADESPPPATSSAAPPPPQPVPRSLSAVLLVGTKEPGPPGTGPPQGSQVLEAAAPVLAHGRPRAASVAVLANLHASGVRGQLAAACVRLLATGGSGALGGDPAAKRRKLAATPAPDKVRARQILLLHWRGTGPQPVDPIRRKAISRTPEEAEEQMLGVLQSLVADGCASFSAQCKGTSECQSALKGGELIGDLGWIDRGADAPQAKGAQQTKPSNPTQAIKSVVPAPVRKVAFDLEVGELSDLVSSEMGIHLLLRTA